MRGGSWWLGTGHVQGLPRCPVVKAESLPSKMLPEPPLGRAPGPWGPLGLLGPGLEGQVGSRSLGGGTRLALPWLCGFTGWEEGAMVGVWGPCRGLSAREFKVPEEGRLWGAAAPRVLVGSPRVY